MRKADKEFLKSQIENLKESAHERSHKCFATVLMQIDYLNLKLLKAEKAQRGKQKIKSRKSDARRQHGESLVYKRGRNEVQPSVE